MSILWPIFMLKKKCRIERRNSRQSSPNGDNQMAGMDLQKMNVKADGGEYLENNQQLQFPPPGCQLDPPPFDPVGIDPVQFDYSNQMGLPSSMDSPNFNMDYTQVGPSAMLLVSNTSKLVPGDLDDKCFWNFLWNFVWWYLIINCILSNPFPNFFGLHIILL